MKSILILIVMSLVFNVVALIAVEAIPSAPQTREDIYIMMKEELMLTVDIYKTQVDILTMTVSLQQRNINMQNDQFSSQIDELSRLKQYEGKFSAEQIDALQKQLDSTREDMSAANLNLDQLAIKVKQAEKKIQDYYDRVNALALQFIKEVESNKKPDLPRGILPTMRESSAVMAKATIETGMDKKAFDTFMGAVDQYIKFVISYGGETDALMQKQQQLLQAYSSADFAYLQYISTKLQLQNLRDLLDAERKQKAELQRRLDELKGMPMGKTYEDKIYFASGSTTLSKEAIKTLKEFAASVPDTDDYDIMITGYADTTPIGSKLKAKYATNWELSLARSSKVVNYMLETLKFPPEKIIIAGKGQYGADQDPEAKELSRKVEFRFVPKSK